MSTKLHIPSDQWSAPHPRLVSRPRLVARLEEGCKLGHRLILVSAPAGYGKTTLLSEWAARSDLRARVAWLSLDEGDNDPTRFWTYVTAALQTVEEGIGVPTAAFPSLHLSQIEAALTGLLNQIAARSEPLVLVLDDYHLIEAKVIHDALAFLLENLPPQMHLAIATRADPPLPIPRLRGHGQLSELYQADLRFMPEEAARFLNEGMGLGLSEENVAALETRTEGWIAALHMAALHIAGLHVAGMQRASPQRASIQEDGDVSAFIQAFAGSHRYIFDYLGDEVFGQQPQDVQDFLLQTAVLDRLSGELCDAVLGAGSNSQSVLEHLEQNNLFVVALDDSRHWYRYHHLFADLLRQRLQRERGGLVQELHSRASTWHEQKGLMVEAVSHALAAEDFGRAACLIQRTGWATFTRGEMTTILGWMATLPEGLVRSHPQLGILRAWATAKSGRLEDVETCLQEIDPQRLPGELAAVRAYVAGVRGDLVCAVELAQRALEHLPEESVFLRAIVTQNLGVAYHWSGNPAAAIRTLTRAIELSRLANQTFQMLTGMAILGRAYEIRGSLRQAVETYRQALDLASQADHQPVPFSCMAHVGMAGPLYEWNDLDGALCCALEGVRLSELGGFQAYQVLGYALLGKIYEARGDRDNALRMLQKAERLGQRCSYALVVALVAELRARLWVAQGNLAAASRWAQERWLHSEVAREGALDSAREIEQMTVAWVLLALGKADEAASKLAWLLEEAQTAGRRGSAIKILALQALAFQAQGDVDGDLPQALAALERALSLAEPEGYVRTFLDEGEPMARLLRQALSRDVAPDYVARLLAALGQEVEAVPSAMDALVEPLTEREMDVLRLIVAGLSNPEIAEELVIAVSTVKSHINHIYGKLGVERRTQAVARAQESGLL